MTRSLVLIGLVAVLAAGVLWWLRDPSADARATTIGPGREHGTLPESPASEAELFQDSAELETVTEPPRATSPLEAVPAAAPPEVADGVADKGLEARRAELVAVLDTFYGAEPDVEGLEALVPRLGAAARVDPQSVTTDPVTGRVDGAITVDAYGLRGKFTVDEGQVRVSFEESPEGEEYMLRDLGVWFPADASDATEGGFGVQHHFDVTNTTEKLELFDEHERIVSWVLGTSPERGTTAWPIVASRQGNALRIGRSTEGFAPIERPWDYDPNRFQDWYSLLSPYAVR